MTRAPAADFVHLDNTHASIEFFLSIAADEAIRARYPRVKLFNLWRSVTPPPQDIPLALCDMRTLDEADGVEGRTVEPTFPDGVPYLSAVHNHTQAWNYFSDVRLDEVIVFQGYDNQPSEAMGCLHGAFRLPVDPTSAVPRASVEQRIFAFYEQ